MSSPWFISDAVHWHVEESYNPDVPAALDCVARKLLQDSGVPSDLLDCVAPVIDANRAKSQRLRVLSVADAIWAQRALWRLEGEMNADDPPATDQTPRL